MLHVTIWMNMPSFYQEDLFRALVDSGKVELKLIFARDLTEQRTVLGWHRDLKGYSSEFLDGWRSIPNALRLAWQQRDRLHIVNGLWAEPAFAAALIVLALTRSSYLIYSEAPDPFLARSRSKNTLRAAFGRLIARRASGALPVSHLAADFFGALGMREEMMYSFGYFRAHSSPNGTAAFKKGINIEVVFIGQVIHRKGLDILLEAMQPLFNEYPELALSVVGSGGNEAPLRKQVTDWGLEGRVFLEGVIPYDKIPARLAMADLLVLPSRWDGWGLVVNEAFAVGVPVIVSDQCGAADLVKDNVNGYVFRSEDVLHLRARLRDFMSNADRRQFRSQSKAAGETISTNVVAPYLIECLQHLTGITKKRPTPPWQSSIIMQDQTQD